jgi:hypothetical protein
MYINENSIGRAAGALSRRVPNAGVEHQPESSLNKGGCSSPFSTAFIADLFAGSVPITGMFAHAVNMESLVCYPKGNAVYLRKGDATIETCQAGVSSNLLGALALAGAGILSGIGLAATALPVAGLGLSALLLSGATNAFTRQEIASARSSA